MTQQAAMLLPMIVMIFLTFGVMLWMLKLRYRAVLKDGLDPRYFRLYNHVELPEYLLKVTQHFHNLLEIPPLYYTAMILLVALNTSDTLYVLLSWAFLLSRLAHSYIHTTSNKLKWRKNVFIISMLILMIIWVRVAITVLYL
jgi:hypothetical protein